MFRDKDVIVDIYGNKYDCGRHIAWMNGFFDCGQDEYDDFRYGLYLDFEKFAKDLIRKGEDLIEFGDGKVAQVGIPRFKL